MIRAGLVLAGCLLAGAALAGVGEAAEAPALACSADPPSLAPGGRVHLRAWAAAPGAGALRYEWEAAIGQLEAAGAEARWGLEGLRPGLYAAVVRVGEPGGPAAECVARVLVRREADPRGGPGRETGRALLEAGRAEAAGYGLYSYLLLGAPPAEAARERFTRTLEAFWGLIPDVLGLEEYVARRELNIAYVPVRAAPGPGVSAAWLLEQYDWARARSILRTLPGDRRDGPYILAALGPVGSAGPAGPHLVQDLSSVPPHLAAAWVKEFLNQAAQERFWEERTGARLAQRLRLALGILAVGLPEVRKGLEQWIAWTR